MMHPDTPTAAPATVLPTTQPAKPKSILVTNIAPAASERNIADFFSYCGKIERLSFRRGAGHDGTSEAIVTFQTDAAVTTALMLSSAQIEGRGIVVTPYTQVEDAAAGAHPAVVQTGDQIQNRTFAESDENRSKTSVIASIIAGGYALGSDFTERAKEYDQNHNISAQLRVGAEELKKKVNEFDQTYGISSTVAALGTAASEKIKAVDQQYAISQTIAEKSKALDENYGISTRWNNAWAATTQYASDMMTKTMQNPTVQSATATINSYTAPIGQSIAQVEQESKALIEERNRQKAHAAAHDPSAQVDGAVAPPANPPVAPSAAAPSAPTQPKQA